MSESPLLQPVTRFLLRPKTKTDDSSGPPTASTKSSTNLNAKVNAEIESESELSSEVLLTKSNQNESVITRHLTGLFSFDLPVLLWCLFLCLLSAVQIFTLFDKPVSGTARPTVWEFLCACTHGH